MEKTNERKPQRGWRLNEIAYIRNGDVTNSGEALILACLLHTKGRGRDSVDMTDVQRLMLDGNILSDD